MVSIDLESSVDTYLYLRSDGGTSGDALHEDDDGGDGTNSRIVATLSAGTYTIEATTYNAGETGSFELTISGLGETSDTGCGQAITDDGTTNGTWAEGCDSQDRPGSYARYYTFTLEQQSNIAIDLESDIDTYLFLRQGESRAGDSVNDHVADDDAGDGLNAKVEETLEAGAYTIEATTYQAGETGSFTLTIQGIPNE